MGVSADRQWRHKRRLARFGRRLATGAHWECVLPIPRLARHPTQIQNYQAELCLEHENQLPLSLGSLTVVLARFERPPDVHPAIGGRAAGTRRMSLNADRLHFALPAEPDPQLRLILLEVLVVHCGPM